MNSLGQFINLLITNKHKDSYLIRLGVTIILGRVKLTGIFGQIADYILRSVFGLGVTLGVFVIDIALDALKEGMSLEEYKEFAKKAYEKATAKIYSEEEKRAIRKQYEDAIDKFIPVGMRRPNSP